MLKFDKLASIKIIIISIHNKKTQKIQLFLINILKLQNIWLLNMYAIFNFNNYLFNLKNVTQAGS